MGSLVVQRLEPLHGEAVTTRTWLPRVPWPSIVIVAAALTIAAFAQQVAGPRVGDALLPTDVPLDARVVVVAFAPTEGLSPNAEVLHRRATTLRDVATVAQAGGARAVGFVDFDSLTFSDGGLGRANVSSSSAFQSLAVAPLLDVAVESSPGALPFLASYRVDPLASELAGVGVPIDRARVVRTVPAAARVGELDDGVIVETPPFGRRAVDRTSTTIVPGFAVRLVELGTGAAFTSASSEELVLGPTVVPLESGTLRIRWSDELDQVTDRRVVQAATLATAVPEGLFRDAIVLVGTIDPAKTTYVDTPVGAIPELLVHAQAVNTLLTREWLRPTPTWTTWLAAAVAAAAVAAFGLRRRPWIGLAAAALLVASWFVAVHLAAAAGRVLPALAPAVAASAAAAGVIALHQSEALRERRRIRSLFTRYVPPVVAQQLITSGRGEISAAGERLAVTALFCDLRGFTPLAARLAPSDVRVLLNHYYDELGRVMFDHGGTVLQYTGDEIFTVFGAPVPSADHAARALACALDLFAYQRHLNDGLLARSLPPLNYGVGIHSGEVVAALVGSSVRTQYSVIGDVINVANRHCSSAREGQLVVSEFTASLAGGVPSDARVERAAMKGLDGDRLVFVLQRGPTAPSGSPELAALAAR